MRKRKQTSLEFKNFYNQKLKISKLNQHNHILEEAKLGREKKRDLHNSRQSYFSGERKARIQREKKLQDKEEVKVQNLEKIEIGLIQELQNTQAMQQNALIELENSLSRPVYVKKRGVRRNVTGISLDSVSLTDIRQGKLNGAREKQSLQFGGDGGALVGRGRRGWRGSAR